MASAGLPRKVVLAKQCVMASVAVAQKTSPMFVTEVAQ